MTKNLNNTASHLMMLPSCVTCDSYETYNIFSLNCGCEFTVIFTVNQISATNIVGHSPPRETYHCPDKEPWKLWVNISRWECCHFRSVVIRRPSIRRWLSRNESGWQGMWLRSKIEVRSTCLKWCHNRANQLSHLVWCKPCEGPTNCKILPVHFIYLFIKFVSPHQQ